MEELPPTGGVPFAGKRTNLLKALAYGHPVPLTRQSTLAFRSSIVGLFTHLPPSSRLLKCPEAVWDDCTASLWVTNETDAWALWRRGFFGKGSYSRSEPSWWAREQARLTGSKVLTAEQVTAERRKERRVEKINKAKEKALAASGQPVLLESGPTVAAPIVEHTAGPSAEVLRREDLDYTRNNLEHLQLQREEAFFLLFALGSITLRHPELNENLSIIEAWDLFCRPPKPWDEGDLREPLRADNPFILSYVTYHHYRSLGWVCRSGTKFCVDWLLYRGADGSFTGGAGPVGTHAEFSVLVMPSYETTRPDMDSIEETSTSWRWLATVNRVTSGVKKTLVLAYVTIPNLTEDELRSPACLQRYTVREFVLRRFIPARMRD
ncbi:uncharacterized protein L969DRAFT_202577 [Mixia osmundae IAM 14324]|uniref:tRNA-splicing endonuclease subunit Sen2 n=1 Tax=Mixia osmundae (strain CBS 9802 / IAM 14324 / JCM 22182 / KY 12970) TaxID=764103 RepID=G7DUS9_MIXOS|nr:uncharacterized protein L969DRAFT_202577 [Mixia osmundae IAM 14324]KEI37443.1 hypothetical protein L969DRAFT_202577 [Mixia osmundae IAM 14324]GAA94339.1 hypothetical protein E5Q_00990 [Mixia osmundae IAM 14324]